MSHERIALPHASRRRALTWRALRGGQPDALFVIVPALALPTKLAAAAYIITFVIGTVAAMGGYAAVIGAGACHGPHEGLLDCNYTQTCTCEMI